MSFEAISNISQAEAMAKSQVANAEVRAKQLAADAESAGKLAVEAAVQRAKAEGKLDAAAAIVVERIVNS